MRFGKKKYLIIILSLIILLSIFIPAKAAEGTNLGVNLESAFDQWTPISQYSDGSMLYPGQWSYNSEGYIVNAENTNNLTGFYNPTTNFEDMDITIKMGSWNTDDDTLGCMIRFSEDANHNCTGYVFAFDRGGARHGGLYKITGKQFANGNLTQLVSFPSIQWTYQAYSTVRMIAEGNNIKVYVDGTLVADYTDPSPITSGSYGFFSYSQPQARFSSISGYAILAEYTAKFDANGGTITGGETTQTVVSTKTYDSLPTAERTGYTFDGWYTSKTGGYKIENGSTVDIAADTTFYARWTPIQYTVTCIDLIDDTNTELGRKTYNAPFDSTTYGSAIGNEEQTSSYYPGYYYTRCSSTTVKQSENTVYRYFKFKDLNLTVTAQNTDNNNKGSAFLDWSDYNSVNTTFKGYQSKDGSEWQSISLMDYTTVKNIKVLQIYPVDAASNQLKTWIETNGYGKNIIKVDSVHINTYNSNPYAYLKNSDGSWKYDVIFFGTWDSNGSNNDLNTTSKIATEEFILSGNGCIFGHDTLRPVAPNFFELGKKYLDITESTKTYSGEPGQPNTVPTAGQPSTLKITKKGLFTSYPWDIGNIGDLLSVPGTHNSQATTTADIWLRFYLNTYTDSDMISNNNFYLVTKNNCSMIQTGHSSGQATDDEQKILANLLFYSYQLTSETSITDYSAMDTTAPTIPIINWGKENNIIKLTLSSSDKGNNYKYKIDAYEKSNMNTPITTSNESSVDILSGLKGYYFIIDDNEINDFDIKTAQFTSAPTIEILESECKKYIHVKAIDNAGNISQVSTINAQHVVTFNANGGTVNPTTKYVAENEIYGTLPIPTRQHYDFLGWYDGNIKVTANTIVTKTDDHTLIAKWKLHEYKVNTSNTIGGIISNESIAEYNSATSIYIIPMDGYEITDVIIDGVSVGVIYEYDFWNIESDHTVIATFIKTEDLNNYLNTLQNKYNWIIMH